MTASQLSQAENGGPTERHHRNITWRFQFKKRQLVWYVNLKKNKTTCPLLSINVSSISTLLVHSKSCYSATCPVVLLGSKEMYWYISQEMFWCPSTNKRTSPKNSNGRRMQLLILHVNLHQFEWRWTKKHYNANFRFPFSVYLMIMCYIYPGIFGICACQNR